MRFPGKRTIERVLNYHSLSRNRLNRYLDHLREGVASFPSNEHNKQAMDELLSFFEAEMPGRLKGAKVLDIGCGDGYLLNQIREKYGNSNLDGISVCRDDIGLARKKHGVKIRFGDMHVIPQSEESVEIVLARHCLEHSPMPLFALFEIYRVLKKDDGVAAVVLPAYDPYWVQFEGHFHCMPKDNWLKLFEVAGFHVLSEEEGYWFAVATNNQEKEWRFLLQPHKHKNRKRFCSSFYSDMWNQLTDGVSRHLLKKQGNVRMPVKN